MAITYRPIGIIHSPFTELSGMPVQPGGEASAPGTVELAPEYTQGLADLDGFSHVILIYHFHHAARVELSVTPFLGTGTHGVFATRAPTRPNPIGMSIVRLLGVQGNVLQFADLDILDGTPLLDIKPYVPDFDAPNEVKAGWLEGARDRLLTARSDGRFK